MAGKQEPDDVSDAAGSACPPADWPLSLPAAFYAGLAEFNRGDYFECHETLEALWITERRSVRELYQGVLQIAVGCYHLTQRANRVGAVSLLQRGLRRLERTGVASMAPGAHIVPPGDRDIPAGLYGIDWRGLIADADRLLTDLSRPGSAGLMAFNRTLLPSIHYRAR